MLNSIPILILLVTICFQQSIGCEQSYDLIISIENDQIKLAARGGEVTIPPALDSLPQIFELLKTHHFEKQTDKRDYFIFSPIFTNSDPIKIKTIINSNYNILKLDVISAIQSNDSTHVFNVWSKINNRITIHKVTLKKELFCNIYNESILFNLVNHNIYDRRVLNSEQIFIGTLEDAINYAITNGVNPNLSIKELIHIKSN